MIWSSTNNGIVGVVSDINAYVNNRIAMMDPFNSPHGNELERGLTKTLLTIAQMVAMYNNLQETSILSDQKEGD